MAHIDFPPPSDEQAFERLIEELAKPVLNGQTVELNGRRGQSQQGVDVSVSLYTGEQVGIQCKLTTKSLSLSTVTSEVANARGYKPELDKFIVATTARSDARLQEQVRAFPRSDSPSRSGAGTRSTFGSTATLPPVSRMCSTSC